MSLMIQNYEILVVISGEFIMKFLIHQLEIDRSDLAF